MKINVNMEQDRLKNWAKRNNYICNQINYDNSFEKVGFLYYPKSLVNNPTLSKSVFNVLLNIDRYIEIKRQIDRVLTIIDDLNFDIERKPYMEQLKQYDMDLENIKNKMNVNLSPYYWDIYILDSFIYKSGWRAILTKNEQVDE